MLLLSIQIADCRCIYMYVTVNGIYLTICNSFFSICIALICLDDNGHMCTGVSTSGRPFKLPGRIGDSALPGCGFYADNAVSVMLELCVIMYKIQTCTRL